MNAIEQAREALEFVGKTFGKCRGDYIFSKRLAIDKCADALAALSAPAQMTESLPPLPEPAIPIGYRDDPQDAPSRSDYFTADQMRKYALAAIESRALSSAAGQEPDNEVVASHSGTLSHYLKRAMPVGTKLYAAPAKPQEQPVAAQQAVSKRDAEKLIEAGLQNVRAAHPAQAPQQEARQARELPPLPAPYRHGGTYESSPFEYYTADQMREYARAAQSAPAVPDGWKGDALKLMDQVDDLICWASCNAPAHLYKVSSGSFWKVCRMIAALASAPAQPTVPEGFALVPRKATEGMIRAAFGWRESDSRAGLIGDADMYERIYYAMISAALASSPDVPGEWERLLTQVIPYRLKLIERGECVDASVEAIRECVARLLASAPAQPTAPEDVAKDAARYRLLRTSSQTHEVSFRDFKWGRQGAFRSMQGKELDEAVDAAIAAAAPVVQGSKE